MQDDAWEEALAGSIQRVLIPIQPNQRFREHLRSGLQLASEHHAQRRTLPPTRPVFLSYWWIGAALGLSVAIGSVLAWVVRSRALPPQS